MAASAPHRSATGGTSLSSSSSSSSVLANTHTPPRSSTLPAEAIPVADAAEPEVLAQPVARAADAASAASAAVGALTSPAAAAQVARSVGSIGIASRCGALRPGETADTRTAESEPAFPQSLIPGLGIGDVRGRFMRGAVVANVVMLVVAVVVGVGCVAAFVHLSGSSSSSAEGDGGRHGNGVPTPLATRVLATCRLPGGFGVLGAVAIDGFAMAGATLVLTADSPSSAMDVALAGVALCLTAAIVAISCVSVRSVTAPSSGIVHCDMAIARHTKPSKQRTSRSEKKSAHADDESIEAAPMLTMPTARTAAAAASADCQTPPPPVGSPHRGSHPEGKTAVGDFVVRAADARWIRWLLLGRVGWFPVEGSQDGEPETRLRQFGMVVTRYRGVPEEERGVGGAAAKDPLTRLDAATAFLCPWLFVFELALTVVMGVAQALTQHSCLAALWLSLVVNAASFAASVVLRPYSVPSKNALLMVTNTLMVAGSGCVVAASTGTARTVSTPDPTLTAAGARLFAAAAMLSFVGIATTITRLLTVKVLWRGRPVRCAAPREPRMGAHLLGDADFQRICERQVSTDSVSPDGEESPQHDAAAMDPATPYHGDIGGPTPQADALLVDCHDAPTDEPASVSVSVKPATAATSTLLDALLGGDDDGNAGASRKPSAGDPPPTADSADAASRWRGVQRTAQGQMLYEEVSLLLARGAAPPRGIPKAAAATSARSPLLPPFDFSDAVSAGEVAALPAGPAVPFTPADYVIL